MKITTDTANTIKDILCRLEKSKFKKLPESAYILPPSLIFHHRGHVHKNVARPGI
jgi:hypothetical protein